MTAAVLCPILKIAVAKQSPIVQALETKHLIFDFATEYSLKNAKLAAAAKEFRLTAADYDDFMRFLEKKDFKYDTETEKVLKDLEKQATKEELSTTLQNRNCRVAHQNKTQANSKTSLNIKARLLVCWKKKLSAAILGKKVK